MRDARTYGSRTIGPGVARQSIASAARVSQGRSVAAGMSGYNLPFSFDRILPPVLVSQNSHLCPVGPPERGTTSILAVPFQGRISGAR